MSTQEILAELPGMSVEDQEQLSKALRDLETQRQQATPRIDPDLGDPLPFYPELAATILYDPTEPASEDEWPAEAR